MHLLADESCDYAVVRALRAAGHDVAAIAEDASQTPDDAVMARALSDGRILLTEDKDFGRLVYARGQESPGVVLIRFPPDARSSLGKAVVDLCQRGESALRGTFVVIEPGRTRISRLPEI